jgi:hypothetical protein|tara:strand:+ start:12051 stop:12245 length:195 start_codon:yes stop_codon:yes gene_type:complete
MARAKLDLTHMDLLVLVDLIWKSQNTQVSFKKETRMDIHDKIKKYLNQVPVKIGKEESCQKDRK